MCEREASLVGAGEKYDGFRRLSTNGQGGSTVAQPGVRAILEAGRALDERPQETQETKVIPDPCDIDIVSNGAGEADAGTGWTDWANKRSGSPSNLAPTAVMNWS